MCGSCAPPPHSCREAPCWLDTQRKPLLPAAASPFSCSRCARRLHTHARAAPRSAVPYAHAKRPQMRVRGCAPRARRRGTCACRGGGHDSFFRTCFCVRSCTAPVLHSSLTNRRVSTPHVHLFPHLAVCALRLPLSLLPHHLLQSGQRAAAILLLHPRARACCFPLLRTVAAHTHTHTRASLKSERELAPCISRAGATSHRVQRAPTRAVWLSASRGVIDEHHCEAHAVRHSRRW